MTGPMTNRRLVLVALFAAISACFSSTSAQAPTAPTTPPAPTSPPGENMQRWKGAVDLPNGIKLDFGVTLHPATGTTPATGTMDIPLQGVRAAALSDISLEGNKLAFTLAVPGAPPGSAPVFAATTAPDGKTASGELHQSGIAMTIRMERVPDDAPAEFLLKRPQEPKPPFLYLQREVTYTNPKDRTTLAGTITIPQGSGPFPAAVMITGSGPQDRDETLLGHKPFLVIADHLARHGIAVLRSDDRGVGASSGSVTDATAEDSMNDALAGVAVLASQPEIDRAHIGLIGHSEGGIVAPMAAAASPDVAFIVMLAGTGMKGRDILTLQSEAIMLASGLDPEAVKRVTDAHRALMDQLEKNAPRDDVERAIRELARLQREAGAPGSPPPPDEQVNAMVAQQLAALDTRWFRSFLFYDPRDALRRVKCPVLALNGSLDTQVPPRQNLPEIEKALRDGGDTDITVRELPGLNHLFQTARTGSPEEYMSIEETFSPSALDAITEWITARTRAK